MMTQTPMDILAAAQAKRQAATDRLEGLRRAISALNERATKQSEAARAAADDVKDANADAIDYQIALATGATTTAPRAIGEAIAALDGIEAERAAVKAALEKATSELPNAQMHRDIADGRVREAAAAVLRESPEVAALVKDAARLGQEFAAAALALDYLKAQGAMPQDEAARAAYDKIGQPVMFWRGVPGMLDRQVEFKRALTALITGDR